MRPTWVEVSRSALRHNFRAIQNLVGPKVNICAVLKANAYGHGGAECARTLQDAGAEWLGVTSTEGGVAMRKASVDGRILLMTGFWQGEEDEVVAQRLTPTIWDAWHIEALQRAAERGRVSQPFPVHLKIDTGMSRLGVTGCELLARLGQIRAAKHLKLEGVSTHFASAEVVDAEDFAHQRAQFTAALETVRQAGFAPAYVHAANSAALVTRPDMRFNMVRPGLALYGYLLPLVCKSASPHPAASPSLCKALNWKTSIMGLRDLAPGQTVGYGATFTAGRAMRIAVLPVGYADGLNRKLSGCGQMMVRGKLAPVVGRVSMDLTTLDVTQVPEVRVGDEVLILGSEGQHSIGADDHARLADTIPYEILCSINHRVPRIYRD